MANKLYDETSIQNIASAIRNKNGSSDSYTVGQMAQAISNIPAGGGGEPEEKDVNFYDYDGTRLYSYTSVEAAALTAFPALPNHTDIGLTALEWNWSLDDLALLVEPRVDIGAIYKTTDGTTKIFYNIYTPCTQSLRLYEQVNRDGTASTIDWGDGSSTDSITTSSTIYSHSYSTIGKYTVTITPATLDTIICFGNSSASAFGDVTNNGADYLKTMITGIFSGSRIIYTYHSLTGLTKLEFITFTNPYNVQEYDPTQTYSLGDVVWYKNYSSDKLGGKQYYRCKTAITTPEAWNSGRWERYVNNAIGGWDTDTGYYSLKAIITPSEFNYGPDQFLKYNYCKVISLGARGYVANNLLSGDLIKENACKNFTIWFKDSLGSSPILGNQNFEAKNLERIDVVGNFSNTISDCIYYLEYYGRRGFPLRDIYLQKRISIPLDGNLNHPIVRIHVPYHLYNDMMDISTWSALGDRLIQMPQMPYENQIQTLNHPSGWITDTRINGSTGEAEEASGQKSTDYIEVTPGETLYVTFPSYSNYGAFYDANKDFVSGDARLNYRKWSPDHEGYIFEVPSTAYYLRLSHSDSYAPFAQIWREIPES